MKRFEVLSHTADYKIRIFGKSKKEIFRNAVFALARTQKHSEADDFFKTNLTLLEKISASSADVSALLVDFLNEILAKSAIQGTIFPEISILKFSDTEIQAELKGKKISGFDKDVKAVTHHGIFIKEIKPNNWQADLLLDI